jgi:hypothetical protein
MLGYSNKLDSIFLHDLRHGSRLLAMLRALRLADPNGLKLCRFRLTFTRSSRGDRAGEVAIEVLI